MSASYITDSEGNVVYPKTLAKCVNKGGSTLEEYLNDVEDATLIKPTVSGTDIVLTDSSNMNIQELHLFGKTEQKTTKGINLLKTEQQDETKDGITITRNDDGTYVLNGTATIDVDFSLTSKFPAEKGKTYRMTGISKEKSGIFMYVTDGSTSYSCASGVGVTFTYTSESGKKYIHLLIPSGKTLNNITVKPMIVDGLTYPNTTYDDYEPYTGGIASPNPDYPQGMNCVENPTVSVAGKNLFEPSTINYSYNNLRITANVDNSQKNSIKIKINTINATEGDLYAFAYVDINKFVKKIKSNTTYTIVLKNPQNIGAVFVGTIIGTNRITNTVAVKSNVIKLQTIDDISNKSTFPLVFYFAGTVKENVTIGFDDIAIYEGDYPNAEIEEFKEIQSAQPTCELNGIDDARDELIVRADGTGQLVQKIKSYDCSQISRNLQQSPNKEYYYLPAIDKNTTNASRVLSTHFTSKTFDKKWGNVFKVNGNFYFGEKEAPDNISDKNAMKQWLIGNKVKILFQLEEPIVTELSSEEVQKILALHTNKPNTTIWNDQDAEMQVTYVADTKKYIDDKFEELSEAITTSTTINSLDTSN